MDDGHQPELRYGGVVMPLACALLRRAGPGQQQGIEDELRAGVAFDGQPEAVEAVEESAQRAQVEAVGDDAQLRQLVAVANGAAIASRGDGQVAAKVAPGVDERGERASALERLQPRPPAEAGSPRDRSVDDERGTESSSAAAASRAAPVGLEQAPAACARSPPWPAWPRAV